MRRIMKKMNAWLPRARSIITRTTGLPGISSITEVSAADGEYEPDVGISTKKPTLSFLNTLLREAQSLPFRMEHQAELEAMLFEACDVNQKLLDFLAKCELCRTRKPTK